MTVTLFGKIFYYLDKAICENLREFIFRNDSLFTIIFLLLFFIEQAILLFLIYKYKNNLDIIMLILSGFALIVVTTASLQKIILDVKVRGYREQLIMAQRLTYLSEKMLDRLKIQSKHHKKD